MANKPKQIKFTEVAERQLKLTVQHIALGFGERHAEKLLVELEQRLHRVATGTIVHRFFLKSKQIRYFGLRRKNYVYKDMKGSIQVLGIYGTKQDMDSIKTTFKRK